jgi:predicted TIM-barrel fold metal-dependent hydrolase
VIAVSAIVDIHCHAFNADDLPVRGFVHRLHLQNRALGATLSDLVDRFVQGRAPGYAADLARLDGLLGPQDAFGPLEAAPAASARAAERFEEEVDQALAELQGQDGDLLLRVGGAIADEDAPVDGAPPPEGVVDLVRNARRAIRWVKLFSRSRLDLIADYVNTFGDEVDLVTPLLVDLGTGLGDAAKTSAREQVVLFEKLSRASMLGVLPGGGKAHVHPFVGFDPLRELRARRTSDIETPLDVVQAAVLRYGFVGVKVYPPMGWRPSGNHARRGLDGSDAAELDRIVDDLARWCAAEQVPITAHCANSNHADPAFDGFGGPDDWLPVLRRHPGLHVNLGHFGGASAREPDDGWPWRIARACHELPGLYADVGNHRIYDQALTRSYLGMVERMLAAPPTDVLAERIMYGSDWFMVAIHPEYERFLGTYRELFGRFGPERTARFLGGNALSFLGFDDPSNKNAQRLLARYRRFAPDRIPSWLAQPAAQPTLPE